MVATPTTSVRSSSHQSSTQTNVKQGATACHKFGTHQKLLEQSWCNASPFSAPSSETSIHPSHPANSNPPPAKEKAPAGPGHAAASTSLPDLSPSSSTTTQTAWSSATSPRRTNLKNSTFGTRTVRLHLILKRPERRRITSLRGMIVGRWDQLVSRARARGALI